MGREAATYEIALSADDAAAVLRRLDAAGVGQLRADGERIDFVVRDPNRYWIDLRLHHAADRRLEIRIALTNDVWSIRAPLEAVLTPMPAELAGKPFRDDDGTWRKKYAANLPHLMALNIKDDEADRLVRELAAETGESMTTAVTVAVRERLERLRGAVPREQRAEALLAIVRRSAARPILDARSADEILGYGADGLPS